MSVKIVESNKSVYPITAFAAAGFASEASRPLDQLGWLFGSFASFDTTTQVAATLLSVFLAGVAWMGLKKRRKGYKWHIDDIAGADESQGMAAKANALEARFKGRANK